MWGWGRVGGSQEQTAFAPGRVSLRLAVALGLLFRSALCSSQKWQAVWRPALRGCGISASSPPSQGLGVSLAL